MFKFHAEDGNLSASRLLDQDNFYKTLLNDLKRAKREVIIESPFMSTKRVTFLLPTLRLLAKQKVRLVVNTKPPEEHTPEYRLQAEAGISALQELGVLVLFTYGHHRKLAIVDRQILYEGSLNILSQNDSCEIMRRVYSEQLANQMMVFLRLDKFIN